MPAVEADNHGDITRLMRVVRAVADTPHALLVTFDGDRVEVRQRVGQVPEGSFILPSAKRLVTARSRATSPLMRGVSLAEAELFPPALHLGAIALVPIVVEGVQRGAIVCGDHVPRGDLMRKLPVLDDLAQLLAPHVGALFVRASPVPQAATPGKPALAPPAAAEKRGVARDSVTGLPLRSIAVAEAERMLERAGVLQLGITAMVLSLDRFRRVNESLGPMAGDVLLRQVAERLRSTLSDDDFVGRRSGDEFVIIVESDGAGAPLLIADRVQQALREPFHIQGHELSLTASMGIAVYPKDADDATQLLRFADMALTRAKTQGVGKMMVFDRAMHEEVRDRVELEKDLRAALREGQLVLYYQSKYAIAPAPGRKADPTHVGRPGTPTVERRHVGAEALMRWVHPERGLVSPARFIPIAEETGLIVPIGTWAMTEVCKQIRRWQDRRLDVGRVSVNVSSLQFARPDFVGTVTRAIKGAGIAPSSLELELTESIVMNDVDHVAARLAELRKIGVRVSVDDFGTGYSSLAYLSRLPLDVLKIDRSFVRELDVEGPRGAQSGAVAQAITSLGHSLELAVLAEGVETKGQLDKLAELGCDEVQGFYFAKPVPPAELEAKLASSAA